MRMHYAANIAECTVKLEVGRQVRRRLQTAFYFPSLEINDHQISRCHLAVRDAARFDDNQSTFAIDTARVTKRVEHQPSANDLEICLKNLFTQPFQHSASCE